MGVGEAVEEAEKVATLVPGTIAAITTTAVEAVAVATTTIVAVVATVGATAVATIVEGAVVMRGVRTIVHGKFVVFLRCWELYDLPLQKQIFALYITLICV